MLLGNVVRDPEIRYFDNGSNVANFALATTNKGYTAANGTVIPDTAEYHNIVAWKGFAKIAEKYLQKGTQIYVEGSIRTTKYKDSKDIERYRTEILVTHIELLNRTKKAHDVPQSREPEQLNPVDNDDDLPF